jgi:hypothetical protein
MGLNNFGQTINNADCEWNVVVQLVRAVLDTGDGRAPPYWPHFHKIILSRWTQFRPATFLVYMEHLYRHFPLALARKTPARSFLVCLKTHWDPTMILRHSLPTQHLTMPMDPRPWTRICMEYTTAGETSPHPPCLKMWRFPLVASSTRPPATRRRLIMSPLSAVLIDIWAHARQSSSCPLLQVICSTPASCSLSAVAQTSLILGL